MKKSLYEQLLEKGLIGDKIPLNIASSVEYDHVIDEQIGWEIQYPIIINQN